MNGKAIMVQGTASHVGKSVLVTALCRIFRQDGLRVAPFKAQNMSLNSYVTPDGREIALAQAVQAEAAGVPAEAVMNPILLKPGAESRSQVVVLGRPLGEAEARQYRERHVPALAKVVEESLRELLGRFDVVVIEGAGSPAEVNLRDRDLTNMYVASLVDAPVLLVADIDRGGMLAAVVGTLALLEPHERDRVAGLVVNKFRGDPELLRPGLEFLSRHTGKPVLGVLPYIPELLVDDEDSVSLDERSARRRAAAAGPRPTAEEPRPVVAVLRLPRIANFTDFAPLERDHGVVLRYVPPGRPIGPADAVIIPDSKSTLADLRWLKDQGYHREIKALLRQGTPVLGICGGYQMLGLRVADPLGVDGPAGEEEGLALLDACTVFLPANETHLVEAEVTGTTGFLEGLTHTTVRGYEIHMGTTVRLHGAQPWLRITRRGNLPADAPEGAVDPAGLVFGTYLHDIFHNDDLRQAFVTWLRRRRALPPLAGQPCAPSVAGTPAASPAVPAPGSTSREGRYDELARIVRAHLDIEFIYRLLDISCPPCAR
jgi:adenosylcobyric acid synthase